MMRDNEMNFIWIVYFFYLGAGIIVAIAVPIGLSILIPVLICCIVCCATAYRRFGKRLIKALPSNDIYVQGGNYIEYGIGDLIFRSGSYETYYFQYGTRHGPFPMKLGFYPQAGYVVHGGGKDDIGTFVISGIYSPNTLRMGLTKKYQIGTGNPNENLGHEVMIQVEWNNEQQEFKGQYYLKTSQHVDRNEFVIRPQIQTSIYSHQTVSLVWLNNLLKILSSYFLLFSFFFKADNKYYWNEKQIFRYICATFS